MTIILSFVTAIIIGALLLKIPFATKAGYIPMTDAVFTAASAVCVTGLIVVDTGSFFTLFGQVVILFMIQIGGLGVMTISVFLFNQFKKSIGINQRQVIQDLYAHTPRKDIQHLLYTIFIFTFISEFCGTISLFLIFRNISTIQRPLFASLFHSVSAFCNAGFSLFPDSFILLGNIPGINITIICLIVFGGLGFPVVYEIFTLLINKFRGIRSNLSLQSKIVLLATIILITCGGLLFFLIESDNILAHKTFLQKVMASAFQSVTCRTAGFNTVSIQKLKDSSLFVLIMLMFIGASPGSCGGGVKTTTISIVLSYFRSRLKLRNQTSLFNKGVAREAVTKAFTLIVMDIFMINIFTLLILIIENGNLVYNDIQVSPFLPVLFEVVSAIGTVGLSVGITSFLSTSSKFLLIILMIVGRVGLLTMAYVIIGAKTQIHKSYAEENIMIG